MKEVTQEIEEPEKSCNNIVGAEAEKTKDEKEKKKQIEVEKDADAKTLTSDTPLFEHLEGIIAGADEREGSADTVAESEVAQAIRSILPVETDVPTMYIPDCESVSTQYSPRMLADDDVRPATTRNDNGDIATPPEPAGTMASMASPISTDTPTTPVSIPIMSPNMTKPIHSSQIPTHLRQNVRYLETHDRHGILRPIHVHIRKDVFMPNEERVRQQEIQINCAFCPPPTIKKIAEVEGLPGQDHRSSTPKSTESSVFNLSSSSDDSVYIATHICATV